MHLRFMLYFHPSSCTYCLTAPGLGDTFKWPSMLGSKELSTKNACALAMILPRPYQKEEKKKTKTTQYPQQGELGSG